MLASPDTSLLALTLRWFARIGSLVSAGLLMAFLFGGNEQINRPLHMSETVMLAFFPWGILLGMALAWRYELIGGLITVSSLAAFYVAHLLIAGDLPAGPYFLYFASPGFLFLLAWCADRFGVESLSSVGH